MVEFLETHQVEIVLALVSINVGLFIVVILEKKKTLQLDIKAYLKQCRECEDWDDRSELKLFAWMLYTEEENLHNCDLFRLYRIRRNMADYLYIHLYGRDPAPPPGLLEHVLRNWAARLRYRRETRVQQKKQRRRTTKKRRTSKRTKR